MIRVCMHVQCVIQDFRHCLFHVTSYELQVTNCELQVTSCELRVTSYELPPISGA